jgi:hypothetical protein
MEPEYSMTNIKRQVISSMVNLLSKLDVAAQMEIISAVAKLTVIKESAGSCGLLITDGSFTSLLSSMTTAIKHVENKHLQVKLAYSMIWISVGIINEFMDRPDISPIDAMIKDGVKEIEDILIKTDENIMSTGLELMVKSIAKEHDGCEQEVR